MSTREIRRLVSDDGKVLETSEYLEGVLDGVSRVYTPGGTLVQELHYVAGQESGEFENGQRIGEYRWYKEDGTLWQSHNYTASKG